MSRGAPAEGESPETRGGRARADRTRLALALLVFALTAGVFWPASGGEFLGYDDVVYVTGNSQVRAGLTREGLWWALSATDTAVNWHPLTWLAHMLDVELFGLDARGHHLSNVFWHALAAALFFLALASLLEAPWAALAAALLFALHPLRVEAVAQVADKKDLLAGAWGAATLWAWLAWRRRGGAARAGLALACYAAGLASKPTLVAWPAVLWLVDRPPFVVASPAAGIGAGSTPPTKRLRALAPFVVLACGAGLLSFLAQARGGALQASSEIPLGVRLANAGAALAAYAHDTVWPRDLCFFYPHPALVGERVPALAAALGWLGVVLATACALLGKRRRPASWLGWLWGLVTLLPVLGLVQVGFQARADRYTYLPAVGCSLALVALLAPAFAGGRARRAAGAALAGAFLVGLAVVTRAQIATWRDTQTLLEHALAVTEKNFLAHVNLAGVLETEGRRAEALEHLELALAIRPAMPAIARHADDLRAALGR